jgi:hypothetical protein
LPVYGGDAPLTPINGPTVDVVGRDLELLINERAPLSVTFADLGQGVLTLTQAAAQIAAASVGQLRAWVDANVVLVLETTQPGTGAALRVVGGDAAPLLGLSADTVAFGKDAHPALVSGLERYTFNDVRGSRSYFYKTRFRGTALNIVSAFSRPVQPAQETVAVSADDLICGQLFLIGMDGAPLKNVAVDVHNRYPSQLVGGRLLGGGILNASTDETGKVEFFLVRGAQVTVAIENTRIARDITVPTDPALQFFNLLDPGIGSSDVFTVQQLELEYAPRRSL